MAQETTALSAKRDELEAVINALPDGLVICTGDHRTLLFNARAAATQTGAAPGAPTPGLDRPLRRWLPIEPLDHACTPIAEGGDVAGGGAGGGVVIRRRQWRAIVRRPRGAAAVRAGGLWAQLSGP